MSMATVFYDESHKKIVESGISSIRSVLCGSDVSEIKSVLLCLDLYLDPYYENTLTFEMEIYDLLQELVISSQDDDVIIACLQLIEDYSCTHLTILGEKFEQIKEKWKPDVKYILNRS